MEANAALGRPRRLPALPNGVENHLELRVVLAFHRVDLLRELFMIRINRLSRTKARMMATFTWTPRSLRGTLEGIATPCLVKARGK